MGAPEQAASRTYGAYVRRCQRARINPAPFMEWLSYQSHLGPRAKTRLEEKLDYIAQVRREEREALGLASV